MSEREEPASEAPPEVKATSGTRGPGPIRRALLGIAWSLALGFLCAGIFAIFVQPGADRPAAMVRAAIWLASHLAQSPVLRGAIAAIVLGMSQALIAFVALFLLALASPLQRPVAASAGMLAEALPSLMVLALQGIEALLPAPILSARIACVLFGGVAGFLAVQAARRLANRRAERARPM